MTTPRFTDEEIEALIELCDRRLRPIAEALPLDNDAVRSAHDRLVRMQRGIAPVPRPSER